MHIPDEVFIVVAGLIGALHGYNKPTPAEKHQQALRNISRLERENAWLDAHNAAYLKHSPPWDVPTR